jgi:serine/threonine protein phosphatase PrpC
MTERTGDVRVSAFGISNVGMVRTNNEDAYIIADLDADEVSGVAWDPPRDVGERGILLAVSDGMGGAAAGEIASAITVESLKSWLHDDHDGTTTGLLMEEAVGEANRNVFDAAQTDGRQGMGATLTAILLRGPMAHIAEVGDSRAYLVRDGRIRQVTRDQSYVQMLVEQGLLTRDQAEASPYRNVILQAMGQRQHVVVALGRLELRQGDRFLLCSDGLSGKVTDDEMREVLKLNDKLEAAGNRLIALANERGGEDNITVVLAEVSGEGLKAVSRTEGITSTLSTVQEFELSHGSPAASAAMPAVEASHVTGLLTPPPGSEPVATTVAPTVPDWLKPPPTAVTEPEEKSSLPWVWIAVAGVVVILIVVVVVLML